MDTEYYEEFVIVIRNDVKEMIARLSKKYTLHVISRVNLGLTNKILQILDP
jgi:hypothetical protein